MPLQQPSAHGWPASQEALREIEDQLNEIIKRVGYAVMMGAHVTPQGFQVPLCYTVGLAEQGLPEIVMLGMPHELARQSINNAVNLMQDDKLKCSVRQAKVLTSAIYPIPLTPEYSGLLVLANQRARQQVPAIQLVYADEAGRYPWEQNFNPQMRLIQPLLYVAPGEKPQRPVPASRDGDRPRAFAAKYPNGPASEHAKSVDSAGATPTPGRMLH
jgi:hypothetical protein